MSHKDHNRPDALRERVIAHRDGKVLDGNVDHNGPQRSTAEAQPDEAGLKQRRKKPHPKRQTTTAKQVATARRRKEILDLRQSGYSYKQISSHVKISIPACYEHVRKALDEISLEPAKELLRMELLRLDTLNSAYYREAVNGDIPSAQMVLRIHDARARLLGWSREHAPTVHIDGGNAIDRMTIEFVLPGPRQIPSPAPVNITPDERRDYAPSSNNIIDLVHSHKFCPWRPMQHFQGLLVDNR